MSQLPNPNSSKKFDRIQGDYGYRNVDGQEEIVHIPTDTSNMAYWKPETVLDPSNCTHELELIDIGKREVECRNCHWALSFNAGDNYFEEDGKAYIVFKNRKFPILA